MTICPYCHELFTQRSLFRAHLSLRHTALYNHNIRTSGNHQKAIDEVDQRLGRPSFTYGFLTKYLSVIKTISCSLLSNCKLEYTRPCPQGRLEITFDDGAKYEIVHLDYCPDGICQYPGPPGPIDDRFRDWGGRGRANNCACRGHPTWGLPTTSQTSMVSSISDRSQGGFVPPQTLVERYANAYDSDQEDSQSLKDAKERELDRPYSPTSPNDGWE